jgi:hypothetical protein
LRTCSASIEAGRPLIDAGRLCLRDTLELTFTSQVGLELGEHAKHIEEALAGGGAGVDRLLGRSQARTLFCCRGARPNAGPSDGRPNVPWLSGDAGAELLKPVANDYLQRWPVSRRVNSSKADADDATLIERFAIDLKPGHAPIHRYYRSTKP